MRNGQLALSNVSYTAPLPPMSSLGNQKWDYNQVGVAHYGMIPDFLADVATLPTATPGGPTGADVVAQLNWGAQYFYLTWRRAENVASGVRVPESCIQGPLPPTLLPPRLLPPTLLPPTQ